MEQALLNQLEELAYRIGIGVRYENLDVEESSGTGGFCRVKGKPVVIIHSRASAEEKIRLLAETLRQFPTGHLYVKPAVRRILEGMD